MSPAIATLTGLLLLIAPLPAQATIDARVQKSLQRARSALVSHLGRVNGGMLALSCLAALHDGVPVNDPVFSAALARLSRAELESTYGLALRLMVMAEYPVDATAEFPDRDRLASADTAELLRRQTTGGFSYQPHDGWWDLSNTQYAALGLRAAVSLGQDVPLHRWRLLYHAVADSQKDNGGFSYRPSQGRGSADVSMTVAGIAVLQICRQHLQFDEFAEKALAVKLDNAWQWLADHRKQIGNLRTEKCFYFHYGLERAAILSDVDQVGGLDWYSAGAEMLVKKQLGSGGWRSTGEFRPPFRSGSGGHPVDSAFAILFLRRKFQKVLAPVTGIRSSRCASLTPESDAAAVKAAAELDAQRGPSMFPQLLKCLRSEMATRRKAATLAIFNIAGDDFGLHPYRSPEENAEAIKAAELWWLKNRK